MKPKSLLLIPAFLALTFFLYQLKPSIFTSSPPSFLKPLVNNSSQPDLDTKLKQKISPLPPLDFSQSQTITSIANNLSYLVYNLRTSKVHLAKNHQQKISPASFTKLLTTQVALDIASPDQLLTASFSSVDKEPTVMELKVGETLPLKDLVRSAIATSANDAAATIAQATARLYGQNTDYFVSLINKKANLLDMTNSNFANPEGYDNPRQYSTLSDIAKLIHNTQNYPLIIRAGASDRQDISAGKHNLHHYLPNWNGLLNLYKGVDGLKIAYTQKAGYSTIVTAQRQDIPLVVILMGADSIVERDLAAAALLDAAYLQHNLVPINITRSQLQTRYRQWSDLAEKIRRQSQ